MGREEISICSNCQYSPVSHKSSPSQCYLTSPSSPTPEALIIRRTENFLLVWKRREVDLRVSMRCSDEKWWLNVTPTVRLSQCSITGHVLLGDLSVSGPRSADWLRSSPPGPHWPVCWLLPNIRTLSVPAACLETGQHRTVRSNAQQCPYVA